ncbi:MAG: hypothetical protein ACOY3D_02205 [Candidatus Omnitrophota bacterium]
MIICIMHIACQVERLVFLPETAAQEPAGRPSGKQNAEGEWKNPRQEPGKD